MPIVIPTPITYLMVDAMYFHAANEGYKTALSLAAPIQGAEERVRSLKERWDEIDLKYGYGDDAADENDEGIDSAHYQEIEPVAIQLEGAEYDVGVAYGPQIQAIAITHILSAASLETHITSRGRDLLNGKLADQFERLPIEAKWLLLPRVLGADGFNTSREPYQGFSKLIALRNGLIHYRGKEEPWTERTSGVPVFLKELGLTLNDARRSLETVRGMIALLAEQLNEDVPIWLRVDAISYFDFRIPRRAK